MRLRSLLLSLTFSLLFTGFLKAQLSPVTLKQKGTFYVLGGLNRNWFSTTNIHYKGTGYDFEVQNLSASDKWKPSPFQDWPYQTPQFSFRIGYIFKGQSMAGFEFGFDHVNYIVNDGQYQHVAGNIGDSTIAVEKLYFAQPEFGLAHVNGSNDITLSFVKQFPIVSSLHDAHVVLGEIKPGGGVLIPRSDVTFFGAHQLHDFHAAGYLFGLEVSVRYTFIQHISLQISGRGSYVNYSNVPTIGDGYASHNFLSYGCLATIGYQCKL